MASLIDLLATGVRKSDGSLNASGTAACYQLGTLTTQTVYSDDAGTIIYSQPITLDANGAAHVYTKSPVRIIINDSSAAQVKDIARAGTEDASEVEVSNANFTATNLNSVLSAAGTSFGGTDFNYIPTAGQTGMAIQSWINQAFISVKAFGAKGDNAADDAAAIQSAITYVAGLTYGGTVYFPPGAYRISSALAVTAANNVSFEGARGGSSKIVNTSTTGNCLTIINAQKFRIQGLYFSNSATSTGNAISLSSVQSVWVNSVIVDNHDVCLLCTDDATHSSGNIWVRDSKLVANNVSAGRAVSTTNTVSGNYGLRVAECYLATAGSSGKCVEINGSWGKCSVIGCALDGGDVGVAINSAATGTLFTIVGNVFNVATTEISSGPSSAVNLYEAASATVYSFVRITDLSAITSIFTDGRQGTNSGTPVAAANDLTLGRGGCRFVISGNTTINAITTLGWPGGSIVSLVFSGTPTVKHNTAGSAGTAKLLLSGGGDLTASANQTLTLMYDGTQWQEMARSTNHA